jgi:hypothetical protein
LARVGLQNLMCRIQFCQKLLGQSQTPSDKLMAESPENLHLLVEELERKLLGSF